MRLYRKGTSVEKGTLLQLKNVLNRTSVPSDPKNNVNACEDFLEVVLIGHVITAALSYFSMESVDSVPSLDLIPGDIQEQSPEIRHSVLFHHMNRIIDKFVNMKLGEADNNRDGIYSYAVQVLSLGLLHAEFVDGIREGDGLRVIQCWKYLLPLFKSANRRNYSIEALNLLTQIHIHLPPRQVQQLVWSRFVNTLGWAGRNVPADLHMEHLNRACKTAVSSLGANCTPRAIVRVGKCIGTLVKATQHFDGITSVSATHSAHSKAKLEKDIAKVVYELFNTVHVFEVRLGRFHPSFRNITSEIFLSQTKDKLIDWIKSHIAKK